MDDDRALQVVEAQEVAIAPTTLFRTDDPDEIVKRAAGVATALAGVIDKRHLWADIRGKKHVLVEGWTLCGSLIGVFPVPVWTHELGEDHGWEARVEARTRDGAVVGAAEAMCTRDEKRWKDADSYAIRSMAQTRATAKAMRLALGFIVTLAGYEATPFEEMPTNGATFTNPVHRPVATNGNKTRIYVAARSVSDACGVDTAVIIARALAAFGFATRDSVTPDKIDEVLDWIAAYDPIVDGDTMPSGAAHGGDPAPEGAATAKEIVNACFELKKHAEKARGESEAKELWKRAMTEAMIPREVRIYTSAKLPLKAGQREATRPELIAFHAALSRMCDPESAA